jgi:hypothetical protein
VTRRRIRLDVGGISAVGELLDDLSPKMAAAFWESLPIQSTLSHGKWSGSACYFVPGDTPMREVTELENPVCSINPGFIVARPGASELLMAYGPAEYRSNIGTDYTTPVTRIVENRVEILSALRRMHDEGDKPISIERDG